MNQLSLRVAALTALLATVGSPRARAQCATPDPTPDFVCEPGIGFWLQETPSVGSPPPTLTPSTKQDHLGISAAGWGRFNGGDWDIVLGGMQDASWDLQAGACPFPDPETEDLRQDRAWILVDCNSVPCSPGPCEQFGPSTVVTVLNQAPRSDRLGWSVCILGDLDGNGNDEIAISAPQYDSLGPTSNNGTVYVLFARDCAFSSDVSFDPEVGLHGTPMRVLKIRGQAPHDWLGFSLAGPGQVVGDQTPDLLIGAPGGSNPIFEDPPQPPTSKGKAYVVDGLMLWLASQGVPDGGTAVFQLEPGTNCAFLEGEELGSRFGWSVTGIGDIESSVEQRNEFAVGAIEVWWNCATQNLVALPGKGNGRVHVIQANFGGYLTTQTDLLIGEDLRGCFGYDLSGLGAATAIPGGDATGDGVPDLLIGAAQFDGSQGIDSGKAYLDSGSLLIDPIPGAIPAWQMEGDWAGECFGWSVAGGGKLDADTLAEFAVGARDFSAARGTPEPSCAADVAAAGLWVGPSKIGRAAIYCGSGHVRLKEFLGLQARCHVGFALVWLPNMRLGDPGGFTELLLTAPGWASCVVTGCAFEHIEIGRAFVEFFNG